MPLFRPQSGRKRALLFPRKDMLKWTKIVRDLVFERHPASHVVDTTRESNMRIHEPESGTL